MGDDLLNLRVRFNIEKEMSAQGAGTCEIKVWNMSPDHLNAIEVGSASQILTLSAGYGGQNKLLYKGPVFYASVERDGPDIVTSMQMMPGMAAISAVYLPIENAQSDYDIYQAVVNAFKQSGVGIATSRISQAVKQTLQGAKRTGFSEIGTAAKFLNLIAHRSGLQWNTVDNELNLFSPSEYEDSEMILLNKDSGMIGLPSKTQDRNYKVRALLNPDLVPGKRVRVESVVLNLKTDIKIIKSTFVGDSMEGDWYTEVEGILLGLAPGFTLVK